MNNIYDDKAFFDAYSRMARSTGGLEAAGEWHQLQPLFPAMEGSRVLDLGCGYGWHCKYAVEQGAVEALGLDLSEKMIAVDLWQGKELVQIANEKGLHLGVAPDTFLGASVQTAKYIVDKGLIEASLSMGSSPLEIIFRVYLREGIPAIARGTTITAISLLNLTAMAGTVGAGGLGDFAVTLGHDRNMKDITNVTVLVLVLLVCLIELIGSRVAKKNTH